MKQRAGRVRGERPRQKEGQMKREEEKEKEKERDTERERLRSSAESCSLSFVSTVHICESDLSIQHMGCG